MAFPGLLLAIAIVSVLGPGLINALLAIGIVSIPVYARVVRSSVLSVKNLGLCGCVACVRGFPCAPDLYPHFAQCADPLIVQGTLGIASAILNSAALSFLGLGLNHPRRNGA